MALVYESKKIVVRRTADGYTIEVDGRHQQKVFGYSVNHEARDRPMFTMWVNGGYKPNTGQVIRDPIRYYFQHLEIYDEQL